MKRLTAAALLAAAGLAASAAQASDTDRHIAQSMAKAKMSLSEAVRTAEKQGDGKAVSASYEFKRGNPAYYEVKVLSNDGSKLVRYDLDPNTGNVNNVSDEKIAKFFTRLKPETMRHSAVTLSHAILTAQERANGKADAADVDREGDTVQYTINVIRRDGTSEKVKINGADGKVASAD